MAVKEDIETWIEQYPIYLALTKEEQHHIVYCLGRLVKAYENATTADLGHFLKAVAHNNFVDAVTIADNLNLRCIYLYAMFLNNLLPMNWEEVLKYV